MQTHLAGLEIEQYSQSALTSGISIVSQRIYLFSGTLRDNLTLAQPETDNQSYANLALKKAAQDKNDILLTTTYFRWCHFFVFTI